MKEYTILTAPHVEHHPGITHIAGRSGSGKTTVAELLVQKAKQDGRNAVYHRMRPQESWIETVSKIADGLGRDGPVYSIHQLFQPEEKTLVVLDDYRHRSASASPELLEEQIVFHPEVQIVTFSLPDWRLAYTGCLSPLPEEEWNDLGEAGEHTGGWPLAVTTMREVISDNGIPETERKDAFYRRMRGHRQKRLSGKQRIGQTGRKYLLAMLKLADGEDVLVSVADIAEMMGNTLSAFGPCRSTLLRSGMIYAPLKGKVGFADPTHSGGLLIAMTASNKEETNA